MHRHVDLLEPIDFREHAPKLRLYLSQVCELAGISKMQLDYWTTKAGIKTHGKKQRIYDYDAIVLVMMIKQGRDRGFSLPQAIDTAREFISLGRQQSFDEGQQQPLIERL
jgi:DNA-binding transcriptional MerR regulator